MIFYKNTNIDAFDWEYSYEELISLNNKTSVLAKKLYKANNFDFFRNLIRCLIYNEDLTILDLDSTENEVINLTGDLNMNTVDIGNPVYIKDIDELIERIKNSTSKITLFTSGTTGIPKKVVHTISSLTKNVKIGDKFKDNVWGLCYNPTHIAGLQVFFQALFNKNTIIDVFKKYKKDIFYALEQGITHLSATPTFYRLLLPVEAKFENVKSITFGGEKSTIELHNEISKLFPNAKIRNIYASTEFGSILSSRNEYFLLNPDLKIIDNELFILNNGEWISTGDLVEWIDQKYGLFKFISRKTEMINVGGNKVNPNEVEDEIRKIEGVVDVKVYGKPNPLIGNMLHADIIIYSVYLSKSLIKEKLRNKLQAFKIPQVINLVNKLDINRGFKLNRNESGK